MIDSKILECVNAKKSLTNKFYTKFSQHYESVYVCIICMYNVHTYSKLYFN